MNVSRRPLNRRRQVRLAGIIVAATALTLGCPGTGEPLEPQTTDELYEIRIGEMDYAQLIDEFTRITGTRIHGPRPIGNASLDCGADRMSRRAAVGRLCTVLSRHPGAYLLLGDTATESEYEIVRLVEICSLRISLDHMFPTVEEFLRSNLGDDELALLLISQDTRLTDSQRSIDRWVPRYVSAAQHVDENAVILVGLVRDLRRYGSLVRMLGEAEAAAQGAVRIELNCLTIDEALNAIRCLSDEVFVYRSLDDEPVGPSEGRDPSEPGIVRVWTDLPHRSLVVRAGSGELAEIADLIRILDQPNLQGRKRQRPVTGNEQGTGRSAHGSVERQMRR